MRVIFEIGVGQCGKRYGLEEITLEHRSNMMDAAIDYVSRKFGGCFVSHGSGAWIQDGKIVREPSITITVDNISNSTSESELRIIADTLRSMFRQDSVIMTTVNASTFYAE